MGAAPRSSPPNPLTSLAVYGLDVGRARARRKRKVRGVWNRAVMLALTIGFVMFAAGVAWVGYQVYIEHTREAKIEHQQGVEEANRKHADESLTDVIDDLEQRPTFNGPGAPALGLGPGTTEP
jgi:hypothetical protein